MSGIGTSTFNANAYKFVDLVTSLARLKSLIDTSKPRYGFEEPLGDLDSLYKHALQQPPCYKDVTELTGQCMSSKDHCAGKGAWLIQNLEDLRIYGVNSQLWHQKKGNVYLPLLNQVAKALGTNSQFPEQSRKSLGLKPPVIDVCGIKNYEIWLAQTMWERKLVDSATTAKEAGSRCLFKMRPFDRPVLRAKPLEALHAAETIMKAAFPDCQVRTVCVIMHRESPDFELHCVKLPTSLPKKIYLNERTLQKTSLLYEDKIQEDHECLLAMPDRLDDELFRGIPPCRGGRTLNILASMASRQLRSEDLLVWKEREFATKLQEDFRYDLPRDKVRHDLVDRLSSQVYIRKVETFYHLTDSGMARYLYCLAKYTKKQILDPMDLVEECAKQRLRIRNRYGYV